MTCPICVKFPSPTRAYDELGIDVLSHSALYLCKYCGQYIDVVEESRFASHIDIASARSKYKSAVDGKVMYTVKIKEIDISIIFKMKNVVMVIYGIEQSNFEHYSEISILYNQYIYKLNGHGIGSNETIVKTSSELATIINNDNNRFNAGAPMTIKLD